MGKGGWSRGNQKNIKTGELGAFRETLAGQGGIGLRKGWCLAGVYKPMSGGREGLFYNVLQGKEKILGQT